MDAFGDEEEDDGLLVKKKNPIHNSITAAQVSLAESSLEARRVAEEIARKNKSLPKRKQQFCGIRTTFADSDDEEDDGTAQEHFTEKLKMELEDADEEDKLVQKQKRKEMRQEKKMKLKKKLGLDHSEGGAVLLNPVEDEDEEEGSEEEDEEGASESEEGEEESDEEEDEDEDEESDDKKKRPPKKMAKLEDAESLALEILKNKQ